MVTVTDSIYKSTALNVDGLAARTFYDHTEERKNNAFVAGTPLQRGYSN